MTRQKKRILIVDDEIEIIRALQRGLVAHGYEVLTANSGEIALETIEQQRPDLLLLDLNLPGISGLEVCKQLRAQSELPPIIVITVRNKERDKVRALDMGADDYVSKPFGINEVLARIRVALRHASHFFPASEASITIGPLMVDFTQHLVSVNGQDIKLTPTEFDLLKIFIQHRGKIMTQHMLLTQIWGTSHDTKSHYLHVYIGHLRRKIEPDPAHPRFLTTISGVGYRFNDDD
ncbi:MAG: response regulator transcription factor [Ktedonobacteraceae bacterium]